MNYRQEVARKTIHLATLAIPVTVLWWGREKSLPWLAGLTVASILVDIIRIRWGWGNQTLSRFIGVVSRGKERNQLYGSTYFFIGSLATVWMFDAAIAAVGIAFLVVGDSAAALVGRKIPLWKLGEKSLGGSIGCLTASIAVGLMFYSWSAEVGRLDVSVIIVGAVVATLIEVAPVSVNDNLSIPLISALTMDMW